MSRNFTLLLIVASFIGFVTVSFSAELASRDPQPRNVVLEEYTGIYCTYCPDGHKRARALKEANPGRVVLINVHAGDYAVPKAGAPDFRTPFGEQLVGLAQVAGFPAGSINRMVFPGAANQPPYTPQTQGGTALSRGGWASAAADSVLNGSISPMNIGAVTKWSNSTRELNVDLELFFTSGIEGAVKLNVALIESHIWGPQTGGEDPVNYEHNFMLRHMLTGQWGEQITTTDKDVAVEKNYKYTVPEKIKIENCDVVIFVTTASNQYIYTGISLPAITPEIDIATIGNNTDALKSGEKFQNTFKVKNISSKDIKFNATVVKSDRTPEDWVAKYEGSESVYTVAPEETADINVSLQVGDTKGIGDAILTISQVDNPDAIPVTKMLTAVSSDAKYLEVNAGATMETTIKEGGRTSLISLSNSDYNIVANKLDPSVVVWNFGPKGGINVAQANIIVDMLGKGIGVLMNGGVALPFLTFESTNHPLLSTLGLNWTSGADIQLSQFTLEGVAGDPVADGFKITGSAGNNGNYYLQPMIITNSSIATEMVRNTDQGKTISARIVTPTAKAIYMGFNLDVITNIADRTNFIKKAIDWIEGTTDVNDNLVDANISLYPNPSSDFINVNGLNGQANVTDLFGRIVWSGFITNNSQIDITTLSSGVYMLNINNNIYKIIKK